MHESIDTADGDFRLSDNARELLKAGGWAAFREACGTKFYSGRTLGAQLSVLYEISEQKERRADDHRANASGDALGVHAEGNFQRSLSRAVENNTMRSYVSVTGGDASVSLTVTDQAQLKSELEHLTHSLARRQGSVLEWETLGYEFFHEVASARAAERVSELSRNEVEAALAEFYDLHRLNDDAVKDLEDALRRSLGDEPWHVFSETAISELRERIRILEQQNKRIAELAGLCMQDATMENCKIDFSPTARDVPKPDRVFSSVAPWQLYVAPEPGNPSLIQFIALRPGGTYTRHFHVGGSIFSTSEGVFALGTRNGHKVSVHIGDAEADESGVPQICVQTTANICNFRIAERPGLTDPDGLPSVQLILTMYDKEGFVSDKYQFQPSR